MTKTELKYIENLSTDDKKKQAEKEITTMSELGFALEYAFSHSLDYRKKNTPN